LIILYAFFYEKTTRRPVVKPCLECKKDVNTKVHTCRSFKGYLMHKQRYIKTKNNPDTTLVIPVSTLAIEVEITSKTIFTKVFNVELASVHIRIESIP